MSILTYTLNPSKVSTVWGIGGGTQCIFYYTRHSGHYAPLFLAPVEGWGPYGLLVKALWALRKGLQA